VDSNNNRRRIIKGWDEQDVYTSWRKLYCYLQRPGAVKFVKKQTHRRERQSGKKECSGY
jgi:hypothetical protein